MPRCFLPCVQVNSEANARCAGKDSPTFRKTSQRVSLRNPKARSYGYIGFKVCLSCFEFCDGQSCTHSNNGCDCDYHPVIDSRKRSMVDGFYICHMSTFVELRILEVSSIVLCDDLDDLSSVLFSVLRFKM